MEIPLIKYPIGDQSFPSIRNGGFVYVDKTPYVWRLANDSKYFFLSRPRRFGKSLLISTLEEYFKGNRELFKGLAIDSLQPEPWPEYPVLHLDFTLQEYRTAGNLLNFLNKNLDKWEALYGSNPNDDSPTSRFATVIEKAFEKTGMPVVVLIDEYDKPILDCIDNPALMDENRQALKSFYESMKGVQKVLRFVMLTGVGKIGNINVFSGLNNIRDLSMNDDFAAICGITREELMSALEPGVKAFAEEYGVSTERMYELLRVSYDGYHFSRKMFDVYNPYSLLNALADKTLGEYWSRTGTPTRLVKQLCHTDLPVMELDGCTCSTEELMRGNVTENDLIPTLYYTGYLTLKGFDLENSEYTLGFPNKEVRASFASYLLPMLTNMQQQDTNRLAGKLRKALANNDLEEFFKVMKVYYSKFDYDLVENNEGHYQDFFYAACLMVAPEVKAEYKTAAGRIDLCLGTKTRIYIVEFKICDHPDQAPKKIEEAFEQIERKQYDLPFRLDGRRIVKLAVVFDRESRNIAAWEAR